MDHLNDVLNRHWQELKDKSSGILNVAIGEKFAQGVNTHQPSITIFVEKKLDPSQLTGAEMIPPDVECIPTDVVELNPKGWVAGKTEISETHPEERNRRLGLIPEKKTPKLIKVSKRAPPPPNFAADWRSWANDTQDQVNCGACLAFDITGVWEALIRIRANDPKYPIKLSEAHLFFCSGGTCDTGNTATRVLNQAKKGVCLEGSLPYRDVDQTCGQGIADAWWIGAKKLESWKATTDINQMKAWLLQGPLVSIMTVHESFFNYVSGIYKSQGAADPVAGGHGIGCFGGNDAQKFWLRRNSWGKNWGEAGWFRIAYGDSECDTIMYQITPSTEPVPEPVKKKGLCSLFNSCTLNPA